MATKISYSQTFPSSIWSFGSIPKYDIFVLDCGIVYHWKAIWRQICWNSLGLLRKRNQSNMLYFIPSICWTSKKEALIDGTGIYDIRNWHDIDCHALLIRERTRRSSKSRYKMRLWFYGYDPYLLQQEDKTHTFYALLFWQFQ